MNSRLYCPLYSFGELLTPARIPKLYTSLLNDTMLPFRLLLQTNKTLANGHTTVSTTFHTLSLIFHALWRTIMLSRMVLLNEALQLTVLKDNCQTVKFLSSMWRQAGVLHPPCDLAYQVVALPSSLKTPAKLVFACCVLHANRVLYLHSLTISTTSSALFTAVAAACSS